MWTESEELFVGLISRFWLRGPRSDDIFAGLITRFWLRAPQSEELFVRLGGPSLKKTWVA